MLSWLTRVLLLAVVPLGSLRVEKTRSDLARPVVQRCVIQGPEHLQLLRLLNLIFKRFLRALVLELHGCLVGLAGELHVTPRDEPIITAVLLRQGLISRVHRGFRSILEGASGSEVRGMAVAYACVQPDLLPALYLNLPHSGILTLRSLGSLGAVRRALLGPCRIPRAGGPVVLEDGLALVGLRGCVLPRWLLQLGVGDHQALVPADSWHVCLRGSMLHRRIRMHCVGAGHRGRA